MRTLTVPGRPYPQGSLRSFRTKSGATVTPQKPTVLTYRSDIRAAWGEPDPVEGPVHVHVEFRFARPKSHFNKKGLKPDAPDAHAQSPDIDKLLRSVLDALTEYAYLDDKQVNVLTSGRIWWDKNETVITVRS